MKDTKYIVFSDNKIQERIRIVGNCDYCQKKDGEYHSAGCPSETCPRCGEYRLGCICKEAQDMCPTRVGKLRIKLLGNYRKSRDKFKTKYLRSA